MTAIIVCNGSIENYSFYDKYFKRADLVICVDGGARHFRNWGVKPNILLGDFDSISKEDLSYFQNLGVEIVRFPVEKDMTDTELAIETALERGCKDLLLIAALGSRFDHSLSNIFLLKKILDKGANGIIVNENNEIALIKDKCEIVREEDQKITLLPLSKTAKGVNIKGFYYPLKNAILEVGSSWGVSNEIVDEIGQITIEEGLLIVIKSRD